jgi:hypothetical protein
MYEGGHSPERLSDGGRTAAYAVRKDPCLPYDIYYTPYIDKNNEKYYLFEEIF